VAARSESPQRGRGSRGRVGRGSRPRLRRGCRVLEGIERGDQTAVEAALPVFVPSVGEGVASRCNYSFPLWGSRSTGRLGVGRWGEPRRWSHCRGGASGCHWPQRNYPGPPDGRIWAGSALGGGGVVLVSALSWEPGRWLWPVRRPHLKRSMPGLCLPHPVSRILQGERAGRRGPNGVKAAACARGGVTASHSTDRSKARGPATAPHPWRSRVAGACGRA